MRAVKSRRNWRHLCADQSDFQEGRRPRAVAGLVLVSASPRIASAHHGNKRISAVSRYRLFDHSGESNVRSAAGPELRSRLLFEGLVTYPDRGRLTRAAQQRRFTLTIPKLRTTALAATLTAGTVVSLPSSPQAQWGWRGGWGWGGLGVGLAAGAIIGSALAARPNYASPYYGYGGCGYGYTPAYYGYSSGYAPLYSYYGGGPYWGYRRWHGWNHW
jgi:hypothetical protein